MLTSVKYSNESVALDDEYLNFVQLVNQTTAKYCEFHHESPCEYAAIFNAVRRCLKTYPEFLDQQKKFKTLNIPHPLTYEVPTNQLPITVHTDFFITRISSVDSREMVIIRFFHFLFILTFDF